MDEPVMVIVGEWECLEDGSWRFRFSRNVFGKCVSLCEMDNFETFKTKVESAFGTEDLKSLSFWVGSCETVFTQAKMPPIIVENDDSLDMFRKERQDNSGLKLYLSLKKVGDIRYDEGETGDSAYEDKEFLKEVSDLENVYIQQTVSDHMVDNSGQRNNMLDNSGQPRKKLKVGDAKSIGDETRDVSDEGSPTYDFNYMTDLIADEYPTQWDPYQCVDNIHWGQNCGGNMELLMTVESVARINNAGRENTMEGDAPILETDRTGSETYMGQLSGGEKDNSDREDSNGGQDNSDGQDDRYGQESSDGQDNSGGQDDSDGQDKNGGQDDSYGQYSSDGKDNSRREDASYGQDDRYGQNNSDGEDDSNGEANNDGQYSIAGHDNNVGQYSLSEPEHGECNDMVVGRDVLGGQESIREIGLGYDNGGQELLCLVGPQGGETNVKRCLVFDDVEDTVEGSAHDLVVCDGGQDFFLGGGPGNTSCPLDSCSDEDLGHDKGWKYMETSNSLFVVDPEPFRDNIKMIRSDKANMNLKTGDDALYVGLVFKNKAELHNAISVYSVKRLFSFKVRSSDKKRVIVICEDKKCDWRIYATKQKDSENMEIRTANLKHTCDVESRSMYGKKATAEILGELIKSKYEHGQKGPRACDVPKLVLEELNVTISYMKAWKTKEIAMRKARGSDEDSYQFLSTYLHLLKTTNPGTITAMKTVKCASGNTLFKYLFFALGASIAGFKYLRKVIVIDGTHAKGKYQGTLVAASGQDGNFQIFPLAFGVIDGENTAGWTWFFRQLSQFISDSEDLVVISDRHQSIYAGLRVVYPLAKHGACVIHLCRNVKHKFKCDGLASMVSNAARAYTVGGFRYWFEEIQRRNPKCAQYLVDIGLPHWTLAYFKGMRYNLMSSNISESLNAALQQALELPITTMVESIRTMLMKWFCARRAKSRKTSTRCTPQIEDILIDHLKDATDCAVIASTEWIYQVNDRNGCVFTVDLEKKTCTCRVFDVLLVPCCHALACVGIQNIDIYSLVGECYSVTTWEKLWSEKILPPGKETEVDVPSVEEDVHPPKTSRGSGRPKTTRIPSRGENPWVNRKCTRCKKLGHNRASCKNPI